MRAEARHTTTRKQKETDNTRREGRQERKTGNRLTAIDRQFTLRTITEGENINQGETAFAYKKKPTKCVSNNFAPNSTTPTLPAHLTSRAGNENLPLSEYRSASHIQDCQDGLRLLNKMCTSKVSLQTGSPDALTRISILGMKLSNLHLNNNLCF